MKEQTYSLERLKPLTTEQYDQCRTKALERVQSRIGTKPQRRDFQRQLAPLWTVLDIIALLVFSAALIVSSIHIITHMGKLAANSYTATIQASAGTIISQDFYTAAHQWGFIALAEGSMILFLVMFGLSRDGWRRWVYFALAMAALIFVIVANWQAGLGTLESILAPLFTCGIGLKLESLIVQSMKRRNEVDSRYIEALSIHEAASQDATRHPDYLPLLRQEIWQKLVSLQPNREFRDAPPAFKATATRREVERDTWAFEDATATPLFSSAPAINTNGSKPIVAGADGDFLALPTTNGSKKP